MRALRTITMMRDGIAYDGWVPTQHVLKEIDVRLRHGFQFKPVPWICFDGLAEYVEIPQRAKRLHVTIHKEKPKAGAWFAIKMPGEGWALRVLTDLNINTNTLSFGAEAVLRAIMKQHKLTTCYALIEWS